MRIQIYLAIIVFLSLTSCSEKEIDDGTFYITEESKVYLPASDSCRYIRNDSLQVLLYLVNDENYFDKYISDTDSDFKAKYYYCQYYENIIKTFESDGLNIRYRLYIGQTPNGPQEFLNIQITGTALSGSINVTVQDVCTYLSSIFQSELNGITYMHVYYFNSGGNIFYFQEDKGLIGFTCNGTIWSLME